MKNRNISFPIFNFHTAPKNSEIPHFIRNDRSFVRLAEIRKRGESEIDLGHGIVCAIAGAGSGGRVAAVGGKDAPEDAG